ncbi:MAG: ComEC family competence protein [Sphingobacteriia bacterium]|nr:MAG: ComEC family competence protein [Sphingobacteriia bacterium]
MEALFKQKPWWQFALIRITIAYTTGIVIGAYIHLPHEWMLVIFGFFFLCWLSFSLLPIQKKYRFGFMGGFALNGLFICIGLLLLSVNTTPSPLQSSVIINAELTEKTNSYQTTAAMGNNNLLIYLKKDSTALTLKEGTELRLHKLPLRIKSASNPGGFNFKIYAASQSIHYQIFLNPRDYTIIQQHPIAYTKALLTQMRNKILYILQRYIKGNKERSVAEALLIGYKKNLDPDLLQAYSSTGVVHIIAISGLHLGMIYGLLLLLLKPLKKISYGKWLKPILILIVLWLFTILTGATPSILRSAIMFSFIILGEQQGRTNYTLNTLAASAFCILVYNPLYCWDIGFQLSYTAVLGIIIFSKPIEKLWFIENGILRYCWQLCSITLAAQIFTLPLLLYYFHQFPNLFLFTNFFAVPLSGIILYLEILLLVLAPIPFLANPIGTLTQQALYYLNRLIENTAALPFATTNFIQVSLIQTICLYGIVIGVSCWLWQKKTIYFMGALGCTTLFIVLRSVSMIECQQQNKLLVYHAPKFTAIDILEGCSNHYLGNPALLEQPLLIRRYLTPSRTLYRAANICNTTSSQLRPPFIFGGNKTILLLQQNTVLPTQIVDKKIDLIILSGSPKYMLEEISSRFPGALFVFDSSNPLWKIERWKKEAEALHLRHHSVPDQGAFELDL